MAERFDNGVHYLKRTLRPSPGKILIFLILAFLLMFMPFYPVHMDRYTGPQENNINEFEESGLKMKSLYLVLEGDYNWTEMDYSFRQESLFYTFTVYHLSFYDANPVFLALYAGLFFVAYYGSCTYIESSKKN